MPQQPTKEVCEINQYSSRICDNGTKSCVSIHSKEVCEWEEKIDKLWKVYHDFKDYDRTGYINLFYDFRQLLTSARQEADQRVAEGVKEEREKLISYIKKMRRYMNSSGPMSTSAVYISPAQSMRNAADEIEAKDKLIQEVDSLLTNLKHL